MSKCGAICEVFSRTRPAIHGCMPCGKRKDSIGQW